MNIDSPNVRGKSWMSEGLRFFVVKPSLFREICVKRVYRNRIIVDISRT